jgi:Phage integrase family/Homeodomain-like domain
MGVIKRIELTQADRAELERIVAAASSEVRMVERARIVLCASQGLKGAEIAERVRCSLPTVVKWRGRYACDGIEGLCDAPRPGPPLTHGPDIDLTAGRLRVGESKTDAGRRYVTLRPALRELLVDLKAQTRPRGAEQLFAGMTATNFRRRTLARAVEIANDRLAADDVPALPTGLTPHSLRRTFASLLYALGEPPPVVMAEMGHTDPALALRIYAQAMRRDPTEADRLRAIVQGEPMLAERVVGAIPPDRRPREAQPDG